METEWDLLVVAEEILKGNSIRVDEEDGETSILTFVAVKGGMVQLRNAEGELRLFYAESLEEEDGCGIISGKEEDDE